MCGIIVCNSSNNKLSFAEHQLEHRGIDAHKRTERDGITFSHFLHSIVGKRVIQPFEGEGVLVANCEIYNWHELAQRYNVSGRNDAEVLFNILEKAHGSEKEILEAIKELDGDFACIYYYDGKLVAFRDPIGVNPLFYSIDPLFFASERKAAPDILRELHPRTTLFYDTKTHAIRKIYLDIFQPTTTPATYEDTRDFLFRAIDKRIAETSPGILFSGGIDSVLLALRLAEDGANISLYTAYTDENSEDIKYARAFAEEYNFRLFEAEITPENLKAELPHICQVIDSSDAVKVSIASPLYFAAKRARQNGTKVIYSGLGADDLFAGYARFRGGHSIHSEQLSSLRSIYERDLYRDNCVAMHNNIELRVPYLDRILIHLALSLPEPLLKNKSVLRKILKEYYSLNEKYFSRPKKAVQYGSGTAKLLRRLARKEGESINALLNRYHSRNIPLAALYTGGKDSAYALYLMKQRNYELRCLITIKSENKESYMFHTPRIDATEEHARRMHLPQIVQATPGEKEKELEDLEQALRTAVRQYGIEGVITGAISSDYQRSRIEALCDRIGVCVFSPLWHVDQEMHMRRLIKDGFKFVFTAVAAEGLDKKYWLNREITEKDIDKLVQLHKKYGINVAGEGGEFESLVIDCPLFKDVDETLT